MSKPKPDPTLYAQIEEPINALDNNMRDDGKLGLWSGLKSTSLAYVLWLPALIIIVDQLTKYGATAAFDLPMNICATDPKISLTKEISPVVDLSILCNEGISWNLLQGQSDLKRWALLAIAIIMVGVLYSILATAKDTLSRLSVALLIGGAIGNAIDRALFGAVTDFVNASDIGFNYVFNVADSAITIGIIGLIITFFRDWRAERAARKASLL